MVLSSNSQTQNTQQIQLEILSRRLSRHKEVQERQDQEDQEKEGTTRTLKVFIPSTKMILFETSTSVFELLWDIALALFIIRLSFIYFSLSFVTGCIITYFRMANLVPIRHFTQPQAELVTLPFFLLFNCLWARFLIVSYEIPKVGGFRLAIGSLALCFMVVAELIGGVVMYEKGLVEWVWETDPLAAGLGAVALVLFGLMPFLLMFLEKRETEDPYHGHGKKTIADAVPLVAKTEKTEEDKKTK